MRFRQTLGPAPVSGPFFGDKPLPHGGPGRTPMSANLAPWPPVEPSQADHSPHRSAQALSADLLATLWDGYAIPPGRAREVNRAHHVHLLSEVDSNYQKQPTGRY